MIKTRSVLAFIITLNLLLSPFTLAESAKENAAKVNAKTTGTPPASSTPGKMPATNSAQIFEVDSSQSQIEFVAVGSPSFLKIKGQIPKIMGTVDLISVEGPDASASKKGKIKGQFEIALTELTTGIDKRDDHTKNKYLEVTQFPKAILTLPANGPIFDIALAEDAKWEGTLNLHGVSKNVTGDFKWIEANAKNPKIKAEFKILLSDFKIAIPEFAGITVANEVQITVQLAVKAKQ